MKRRAEHSRFWCGTNENAAAATSEGERERRCRKKQAAQPCGAREGIVLVSANRRRSGSPIPFGQSSLPRPPPPPPRRSHPTRVQRRAACPPDKSTTPRRHHPPNDTGYYNTTAIRITLPPRATIKIDPGHTQVHNARENIQNIHTQNILYTAYYTTTTLF